MQAGTEFAAPLEKKLTADIAIETAGAKFGTAEEEIVLIRYHHAKEHAAVIITTGFIGVPLIQVDAEIAEQFIGIATNMEDIQKVTIAEIQAPALPAR